MGCNVSVGIAALVVAEDAIGARFVEDTHITTEEALVHVARCVNEGLVGGVDRVVICLAIKGRWHWGVELIHLFLCRPGSLLRRLDDLLTRLDSLLDEGLLLLLLIFIVVVVIMSPLLRLLVTSTARAATSTTTTLGLLLRLDGYTVAAALVSGVSSLATRTSASTTTTN